MSFARLKGYAETTFAIHESRDVGCKVHWQVPGPACYGAARSIQGSQPLSRYGDRAITILPSVLPAALLQRREGFTDLSRLVDGIAPAPGNVTYPTRNFAQLCCPFEVSEWGPDISAGLCMSP